VREGRQQRSKVVKNCTNPQFNEEFFMVVDDFVHQKLQIKVCPCACLRQQHCAVAVSKSAADAAPYNQQQLTQQHLHRCICSCCGWILLQEGRVWVQLPGNSCCVMHARLWHWHTGKLCSNRLHAARQCACRTPFRTPM